MRVPCEEEKAAGGTRGLGNTVHSVRTAAGWWPKPGPVLPGNSYAISSRSFTISEAQIFPHAWPSPATAFMPSERPLLQEAAPTWVGANRRDGVQA